VTANSHKVIRNLLDEVCRVADEIDIDLTCIQKVSEEAIDESRLRFTTDNVTCLSALHDDCQVAGGTAWFWTRPDAVDAVDVLFVDEAAQMSLANVLASSQAAKTIVLLGDPSMNDPCKRFVEEMARLSVPEEDTEESRGRRESINPRRAHSSGWRMGRHRDRAYLDRWALVQTCRAPRSGTSPKDSALPR
jgi:hypothetical protein